MMWVEMTKQIVQNSSAVAQDDAEATVGISQRKHRIFDCAAAILGAMLFAPIILIVTIAIRLDSPGPIFIRELRFGHRNRAIQVFKFRLASDHSVGGPGVRSTRVGRILSGTGIDELPQLYNVLWGELSIFGPPLSPCPHPRQNKVKPGMIRWSQFVATIERRPDDDAQ
jgi:lipopolysaccharide/colanic/teichoic acid biosynthesis glycosyltransferase